MNPRPVRVAIVNVRGAHYRQDLYELLDRDDSVEVFHYFSENKDPNLPQSLNTTKLKHYTAGRHHKINRFIFQRGVNSFLREVSPDVVILLGDMQVISNWIIAMRLKLKSTPVIFWTMGWRTPEAGIKKRIRLCFYGLADQLLLYGNIIGKDIGVMQGYPENKMTVIYNSYSSLESMQEASGGYIHNDSSTTLNIGAVARLTKEKQFNKLLTAAQILIERGYEIKVYLLGDGPQKQSLLDLASAYKVPLNIQPATYNTNDLSIFYQQLDLVCIPEFAGLSIIQAHAHRLPCITHSDKYRHGPEIEAAIEAHPEMLYTYGSTGDLADTIERWLIMEPEQRSMLRENCFASFRKSWTAENQQLKFIKAISEIVQPVKVKDL